MKTIEQGGWLWPVKGNWLFLVTLIALGFNWLAGAFVRYVFWHHPPHWGGSRYFERGICGIFFGKPRLESLLPMMKGRRLDDYRLYEGKPMSRESAGSIKDGIDYIAITCRDCATQTYFPLQETKVQPLQLHSPGIAIELGKCRGCGKEMAWLMGVGFIGMDKDEFDRCELNSGALERVEIELVPQCSMCGNITNDSWTFNSGAYLQRPQRITICNDCVPCPRPELSNA